MQNTNDKPADLTTVVVEQACTGPPLAAGLLALPGALVAPRTLAILSVAACAISPIAGSNAVISLILRTCEHNNFSFRLSLYRPPKGF